MRDFDGDGTQDLAIVNTASNSVSVFAGNGDHTFRDVGYYTEIGIQPYSIVAQDFDGDGILDLAVSNSFDDPPSIIVLRGNGDGTFGARFVFALDSQSAPHILAAGDFNRDGQMDLAVAASGSNYISILINNSR